MSEPVSNVEIEDVLSSIRRLVSEETRIEPRPDPQKTPPPSNRLVLTPALRVAPDPEVDQEPDRSEPADSIVEAAPEPDVAPLSLRSYDGDAGSDVDAGPDTDTDTDTDLDTDIGPDVTDATAPQMHSVAEPDSDSWTDFDPEPEASSRLDDSDPEQAIDRDAPWQDPDTTLFQAAESLMADNALDDDEAQDEAPEDSADANAQPVWDAPEEDYLPEVDYPPEQDHLPEEDRTGEDLFEDDLPAEDRGGLDTGDTDQDEQDRDAEDQPQENPTADPLASESSPPVSSPSELRVDDEPTDADPQDQTADSVGETPPDAPDQADASQGRAATLSAKIAALEEKIGQTQDQWEPDGEVGDDYAGTQVETIEWQDHTDDDADVAAPYTAPRAEPVSPPSTPVDKDDETPDFLGSDDTILDEESLRELVADIVREELQGALGERITRNVRKLVRREIHRALTAQELD